MDTVAVIREATVKSIILLSDKVTAGKSHVLGSSADGPVSSTIAF